MRIRIDPMVPIREWEGAYGDLVCEMAEAGVRPERFTLGTLRFFPSVQPNAFKPESAVFYAVTDHDDPDDRLRVPEDLRVRMYRVVRTGILDVFGEVPV